MNTKQIFHNLVRILAIFLYDDDNLFLPFLTSILSTWEFPFPISNSFPTWTTNMLDLVYFEFCERFFCFIRFNRLLSKKKEKKNAIDLRYKLSKTIDTSSIRISRYWRAVEVDWDKTWRVWWKKKLFYFHHSLYLAKFAIIIEKNRIFLLNNRIKTNFNFSNENE